jgi:hypothetical protein
MTEVQPFRLPSRSGAPEEIVIQQSHLFQRDGIDSTTRDLFLNELFQRYPHDTRVQASQTRQDSQFGESIALCLLPGVSNGPKEAFLDYKMELREFLSFCTQLYSAPALHFPI